MMGSARSLILVCFVLVPAVTTAAAEDAPSVAEHIACLKSEDAKVRSRAVNALMRMGPRAKGAVGALIEILGDEYSSMRENAAEALGNIGPPAAGATGALATALKDEKYWVRRSAAMALVKIGPGAGKAVGALAEALKDDNILVRRFAADALAAIGKPTREVIDGLEKLLKDKDVSVRLSAARTLAKLGEGKRAVSTLVATLKHHDIYERRPAVEILETIGPDARKAAGALLHAVKDVEGWRDLMAADRKRFKEGLRDSRRGFHGDPRAYEQTNWRLRFAAARALGKIDPKTAGDSVVPVLIKMLSHDTTWVRSKSTEALGAIGKPAQDAIQPLEAILATERSEGVCLEAHKTLRLIRKGSPTTQPARSDGLLAWFAADGSLADNAGTNDGRIVGNVKFTGDRHGTLRSALAFNKDGGRVIIPDSDQLDTDAAFTLSAWVARTHDGTETGQIVSKWQDTTRGGDYVLSMTNAGQVCLTVGNKVIHSQQDHIYSNSRVPKGRWAHVAAVFDRGEMKLYIDGMFDAGKKSTKIRYVDWKEYQHDDISIGAMWDGKFGFRGVIDEIRIYGRALNASEIHSLFGGPAHVTRSAENDRIELSDGGIITGRITNDPYVLTTPMGKVVIAAHRVAGIKSGGKKIKGLQLLLTDTQIISGTLDDQVLQIDGPDGKTLEIRPGKIVQCGYRITRTRPARTHLTHTVLTFRNGDRLAAKPLAKLQIKSPYATIDPPSASIIRIEATSADGRAHRVMLAGGSRLSGELTPRTLAIKLQLGPKFEVRCEDIVVLSSRSVERSATQVDAVLMRMANGDCLSGLMAGKTVSIRTEFGDIAPAWGAIESIRPGKGKGQVMLKMRNGAVYRGQLGGPHTSFTIAGTKQAIKIKTAEISSITTLGKPSPTTKN
ncbi:MAG: HEAT repeat domain-containing protein [Phycisphaerae bacterium]|jgi:HEAT repeat protein|nr:HEAT repeat domain-containing protein [Phycisphaerae bacterium]